MPWMAAAAGISAGGSLIGGLLGSSASNKAAAAQVAAQNQAIQNTQGAVKSGQDMVAGSTGDANNTISDAVQAQLQMYAPYIQEGGTSLQSLSQLAGAGGPLDSTFSFNPQDLENDPGYKFTLQQGQDAIQRAAAARGGLFSTGTLKSLAGYTTGTANQYFGDAFNRSLNTFNTNRQTALNRISTLQGLAGMGYGATGAAAGATQTGAGEMARNTTSGAQYSADLGLRGAGIEGNAISGKGNAEAAGIVGSTNAETGGISGATNAISQFLMLRALKNAPTGAGAYA